MAGAGGSRPQGGRAVHAALCLLARAGAREKEIATRSALGATRAQIVTQLLWECAAIGILALPLALLLTRLCLDYFLSLVPDSVTYMDQFFRFDGRVVGFAALVTGLTVLLFGLVPALHLSRVDPMRSLRQSGRARGPATGRLRGVLLRVRDAGNA